MTVDPPVMLAAAVLLAAWLDHRYGEPPNAWHPVAWLGSVLSRVGRRLPDGQPATAFIAGGLLWLLVTAGVGWLAWRLQVALLGLSPWLAVPLLALALKPAFAWRMLDDEVAAVEQALTAGNEGGEGDDGDDASALAAGRDRLSRLCSRDVASLDAVGVRETAIESLAENLNDSLVAPLFWTVVAGLPGAWIWRAANTMDAMWGYRDRWEWAGKWAARADDVLAWAPARLTALALWRPGIAWRRLRQQARLTPSPNGGWPMAAMALRLDVRLTKPGVYALNGAGRPADPAALVAALAAGRRAAWVVFAVAILVLLLMGLGAGSHPLGAAAAPATAAAPAAPAQPPFAAAGPPSFAAASPLSFSAAGIVR